MQATGTSDCLLTAVAHPLTETQVAAAIAVVRHIASLALLIFALGALAVVYCFTLTWLGLLWFQAHLLLITAQLLSSSISISAHHPLPSANSQPPHMRDSQLDVSKQTSGAKAETGSPKSVTDNKERSRQSIIDADHPMIVCEQPKRAPDFPDSGDSIDLLATDPQVLQDSCENDMLATAEALEQESHSDEQSLFVNMMLNHPDGAKSTRRVPNATIHTGRGTLQDSSHSTRFAFTPESLAEARSFSELVQRGPKKANRPNKAPIPHKSRIAPRTVLSNEAPAQVSMPLYQPAPPDVWIPPHKRNTLSANFQQAAASERHGVTTDNDPKPRLWEASAVPVETPVQQRHLVDVTTDAVLDELESPPKHQEAAQLGLHAHCTSTPWSSTRALSAGSTELESSSVGLGPTDQDPVNFDTLVPQVIHAGNVVGQPEAQDKSGFNDLEPDSSSPCAAKDSVPLTLAEGKEDVPAGVYHGPVADGGEPVVKDTMTTSKREARDKRKQARGLLKHAWLQRESTRARLLGNFSLEGAQVLATTTQAYMKRRNELEMLMPGGSLNVEDARVYPMFSESSLSKPKVRPEGLQDLQSPKTAAPAVVPHVDKTMLDKAKTSMAAACQLRNESLVYLATPDRSMPHGLWKSKGDVKLQRATAFYKKKRDALVAAYGDAGLPSELGILYPPVP